MDAPKILEITAKKMAMMKVETSLANNKTVELWQRFKPRVTEIGNRIGTDFFSIQVFDPKMTAFSPDTIFETLAAIEVTDHDNLPECMEAYTLEGGKYAKFMHLGPVTTYHKTSQYIHDSWFPQSNFVLDHRNHFQVMSKDYQPHDPNAEEEIWVPLSNRN